MQCSNCGALCPAGSWNDDTVQCDSCESHRVLPDDGAGLDGVVFLGGPADLDCPACSDQLVTALFDDQACSACPSCDGVALELATFANVVARRRLLASASDRPAVPLDPADPSHVRECPVCRERMNVHPYHGPGRTVIESCRGCRLVWLDAGETSSVETRTW